MASLSVESENPNKSEIFKSLLAHNATGFFEGKPVVKLQHYSLLSLFLKDEHLYVLLTVRSRHMRMHRGEVAFPGGKQDKKDKDSVETALREAEEEIGLPRDQVEVITQLAPYILSIQGHDITPVLGFIINKDFIPKPNADEVEHTFYVPLANFLSSENHASLHQTWEDHPYILPVFSHPHLQNTSYRKTKIYGLTAHIAMAVACIVYKRPPDFEVDSELDWENPNRGCEANYFRFVDYYNNYNKQSKL